MARRCARRAVAGLMLILATLLAIVFSSGWEFQEVVAAELLLIGAIVLLDRFAGPVIGRWVDGALGEEHVGRVLEELEPEGWLTIHDVYTGRGNIDAIVIGPAGLFTVEVKSYQGKLSPERVRPADLKQAYAQKKWLESVADLPVDPLLVFSRAFLLGRAVSARRGVVVLPARMLTGHLRRRSRRLSDDEVCRLHERLVAALDRTVPAAATARPS